MSIQKKRPVVIGITGGSGSGKTTVARKIFDQLSNFSITIIQQDSYYNDQTNMSMADRKSVNYDHPMAFDFNLLID